MSENGREDVTVDFDHHAPEVSIDPYSTWEALRNKCPVTWTEAYDGFWVLTDYATVFHASRDDETFISGGAGVGIPSYGIASQIPLETDAPMTQKYRRLLQTKFSPAAATEAEPTVRAMANELMDAFVERGEADIVAEFSIPTTARFILRILGFPEDQWEQYTDWVHTIVHSVTSDPEAAFEAVTGIYSAILEQMEEHRANGFPPDITSDLLTAEIDGEPVEDDIIANYLLLLIFGGLDTTSSALGNAIVRLERQPELRRQLLERPELMASAIEELLRIDAPVQALARTVTHDMEMCGQRLEAGDRALLVWAAANRDPAQFPNPHVADFERVENRHLTFGVGLHRCLGSHYGRTMFKIMLETVLARIPDYALADDPDRHRIEDAAVVWGHHRLPIRFTPGRRLNAPGQP